MRRLFSACVSRTVITGLAVLLAGAPPIAAQAAGAGIIEGTVTVAGTAQPLSDVQVALVGTQRAARTDEAGKFRIPGVPAGAYQVRAQRIGYGSITHAVSV